MCIAGTEVQCPMIAEFSSAGSQLRASRSNEDKTFVNLQISRCAEKYVSHCRVPLDVAHFLGVTNQLRCALSQVVDEPSVRDTPHFYLDTNATPENTVYHQVYSSKSQTAGSCTHKFKINTLPHVDRSNTKLTVNSYKLKIFGVGSNESIHTVRCNVDYCNLVLESATKKGHKQVAMVQNAAACLITGTQKHERGLSRLLRGDLHWLAASVHRCLRYTELQGTSPTAAC